MSFLVSELIAKTRDAIALNDKEMSFLVDGISTGSIPDYQIAAWLMAAYLKGLSLPETKALTQKMKESGRSLHWNSMHPDFKNLSFVDKHSTGGVGDKVSLILAPLAAAMGLKVPMMSGRGLGHTGGTVDKLEAIPGFSMYPSSETMLRLIKEVGFCMMAQAADLCPADKKLYALRDVTATVSSIPLITASILSKKWAEGAQKIVFDVKCGSAAFMESFENAKALARSLVGTAKEAGIQATALVTRMEEPLGRMVGNSLEVVESLEILKQNFASPKAKELNVPLTELTLDQVVEMALLCGAKETAAQIKEQARLVLSSGAAYKKFCEMAEIQGAVKDWEAKLPKAPLQIAVRAAKSGFVSRIHSKAMGLLAIDLGAGRKKAEDKVDPAVGFELCVSVGEKIEAGQTLMLCHCQNEGWVAEHKKELEALFELSPQEVPRPANLVLEKIC